MVDISSGIGPRGTARRPPFFWVYPATVLRNVDADTVRLDLDAGFNWHNIANARLAGINAPELATPAGKAARGFLSEILTAGDEVTFTSRQLDKYGRPLGDVTLGDGRDLGQLLVAAGHATPMRGALRR